MLNILYSLNNEIIKYLEIYNIILFFDSIIKVNKNFNILNNLFKKYNQYIYIIIKDLETPIDKILLKNNSIDLFENFIKSTNINIINRYVKISNMNLNSGTYKNLYYSYIIKDNFYYINNFLIKNKKIDFKYYLYINYNNLYEISYDNLFYNINIDDIINYNKFDENYFLFIDIISKIK